MACRLYPFHGSMIAVDFGMWGWAQMFVVDLYLS
jgi:hypothetical protein